MQSLRVAQEYSFSHSAVIAGHTHEHFTLIENSQEYMQAHFWLYTNAGLPVTPQATVTFRVGGYGR
jgi:hypothetical protein